MKYYQNHNQDSARENLAWMIWTLKINAERSLKHLLAAFLDVSGAFDNVRCDTLLDKLATIGCSESIIKFVHFLLNNREIHTEI